MQFADDLQYVVVPESDLNGNVTSLLAIGRDITEIKRAEKEHRLHAEFLYNMDRVNRAIQVLSFGPDSEDRILEEMTGELGVKSFLSLALYPRNGAPWVFGIHQCANERVWFREEKTLFQEIGRQFEDLIIINRSGEHLPGLINDVLDISKIESGKMDLAIVPFDLGLMVRDVMELMRLRAMQKGVELILDQSSKVPCYIKADEARLRQILVNLVGNAVKFTDEGTITIRLDVRYDNQEHLRIEVQDTGPGKEYHSGSIFRWNGPVRRK